MLEWLGGISPTYLFMAGAAGFGGLASFLLACKLGQIRNNRHIRKAALEIVGGSIVGFFLSMTVPNDLRYGIAFCGGVGWSTVINVIRRKVTSIVEAVFFGPITQPRRNRQNRQQDDQDGEE